ncbi:hypothetical protein MCEMIH22_01658 [Candidatus Methylacidiphilaceae bacterium]
MRKEREGLCGAVIDIEGDHRFEGFSLEEALKILDGERGGVLAPIFGGASNVGEEGNIGQAAERGVLGERFGFVDIEADLEVGGAVTGDTDEGGFVDDGASADVDEGAAGADRAEEFFGYDVVILFCVGGEFDDDVMLGEEVVEGGGTGNAVFLEDGVRDAGGEGGDRDIERAEEGNHFLGDGTEPVEADASAEEALGDGFHTVLPSSVPMHCNVPVSGAAHRGEDEEEAAFGDGTADGIAPVGDEEAVFDQFSGDELFHATGEIGHIAELARFADGKVVGDWRATPRTEEGFGLMFFEKRLPGCWIA